MPDEKFTRIPNYIIESMPIMHRGTFAIVIWVARQTTGWQKEWDKISLSQFQAGTGLSRQGVIDAIADAVERGWVEQQHVGKQSFQYRLTGNVGKPVEKEEHATSQVSRLVNQVDQSTQLTSTSQVSRPELVNSVDPQKKEIQSKEISTNVDAPTAAQDELLDLPPVGKPKRTRKVNPNSADSWAWITTLAETLGMDARINAKRLGTLKDVLKRGDIELEDVDYFRLRYWPNDKRHQWKEFPSQAELQAEIGRVRAMRLKEVAPKRTEPRITRINMNGKPTDAIEYPDGTTEYREVRA